MTQIERRQTRLRRIRAHHQKAGTPLLEDVPTSPGVHHTIGVSQNFPENISVFLERNGGDPAIKVAGVPALSKCSTNTRWSLAGFCSKT